MRKISFVVFTLLSVQLCEIQKTLLRSGIVDPLPSFKGGGGRERVWGHGYTKSVLEECRSG